MTKEPRSIKIVVRRSETATFEDSKPAGKTFDLQVKRSGSPLYTRVAADGGLRFSVADHLPLVEIQVPTINYRMGVQNMAIGVVSIQI